MRKDRFNRIVLALHKANFDVGAWAARVIEDVQANRDAMRVGLGESVLAQQYEGENAPSRNSAPACETNPREQEGPLVSIQTIF